MTRDSRVVSLNGAGCLMSRAFRSLGSRFADEPYLTEVLS